MVTKTTDNYVPWSNGRAVEIVERHRDERGPLLPILHELQQVFGCVPPEAIALLAGQLNISQADVYGVVSFYKDFRSEPPGSCVVHLCRGEACQSMGAERLARHARDRLGLEFGATAADGSITLEQVFCLGNCALSPAVMVDGRLVGRVDEACFDEIVASARAQVR